MKFSIPFLSRTGKAALDVEIADGAHESIHLRLAVEASAKAGENLYGANLGGAHLVGANLGDAHKIKSVLAILSRIIEPYRFVLWRIQGGAAKVSAGCHGPWTVEEYRAHVAGTYAGTPKAAETLRILDFFDATDKATKEDI